MNKPFENELLQSMAIGPEPAEPIPETVYLLSAVGEAHEAPPAARERAAFSKDGILYVAEGASTDMHVLSYRTTLRRAGLLKSQREVPYTAIKTLYERHGTDRDNVAADGDASTLEQEFVQNVLKEATDLKASDIHFTPINREVTEVRYRIMGDLYPRFKLPNARAGQITRTVYDSMCDRIDANYDVSADQNGRLRHEFCAALGLHNARIATGPVDLGQYMAIRLHYDLGEPKPLTSLGFDEDQAALMEDMSTRAGGIIIFSGATGSGKSTVLANWLSLKQKESNGRRNLVTGEDPPELPIFGAVQKAVQRRSSDREDEARAWSELTDTFLRWDPDWLYIAEMRLRATMDAAIKAALSSQLTFATLHANDASAVQDKMREAGISMSYLCDPAIIVGAVNQSLVPILCPLCSTPYLGSQQTLSSALRQRVEAFCTPHTVRLRGAGCEHCHAGAMTREPAVEVIVTDHEYMSVYAARGSREARRHWIANGGKTKTDSLIEKINAGRLDPRDAERLSSPLNADAWARRSNNA
jgi:type II secretory ATPase GspE/PulE/Tfp pilus assembly ATPase PilB-like protein